MADDKDKEKKDKERLAALEAVAIAAEARMQGCEKLTCGECSSCAERVAALRASLQRLRELR